jgi:hypothetical protein
MEILSHLFAQTSEEVPVPPHLLRHLLLRLLLPHLNPRRLNLLKLRN